jgi:hypothetical protein
VQQELYGATDATLSRIARLTADHAPGRNGDAPEPEPIRFWAPAPVPAPSLVHGIELADSVTLMLPSGTRTPDADDLAAVQDAAGQLLAVLRQRGLAGNEGNAHDNAG